MIDPREHSLSRAEPILTLGLECSSEVIITLSQWLASLFLLGILSIHSPSFQSNTPLVPFHAQLKCFEGSWLYPQFQRWTQDEDLINQHMLSPWPHDWARDGCVTRSEPMRLHFGTWDETIREKGFPFHCDAKLVGLLSGAVVFTVKEKELAWEWNQHGRKWLRDGGRFWMPSSGL